MILLTRAKGNTDANGETARDEEILAGPVDRIVGPGDPPHELLVAWVQFLKADIMEAVNTLHNRLNVVAHYASEALSEDLSPELRQSLERIKSEGERSTNITTGLLNRVHSLAPDSMPPVLFDHDGSTIPPGYVLLVENDEANRTVIGKVFRRLGHEVTAVTNGLEAYSELEAREADCIICDVRLPYLDGRTLFEQVEQKLPHLASRFVFVTGDYTNPATLKFLRLSGQPFIGKPYELDALIGAVAAVLGSRCDETAESGIQQESEI